MMGICAVWGSPQSGKTTLAVNLAYAISRGEKTVCLISPVEFSELSAFFGVKIPKEESLQEALRGNAGIWRTAFKVDDLFYVVAAPATADAFELDYTSEQAKMLLEVARMTFDIVIVDCPSETNNLIAAWSLNKADKIALCLGGHISCVMWYMANERALQAIREKTVYVSSEATSDFDYGAMYQLLKCTPDVRIPYIREATLLQNEKKLIYHLSGKKGRAYSEAIKQLYEVMKL